MKVVQPAMMIFSRPGRSGGFQPAARYRVYFVSIAILFMLQIGTASVLGQIDDQDPAPPPLRTVSKEERAQLDAVTDVKKRTKLALELMNTRLRQAETLHGQEQFDDMFKQLGGFHGLMDNTLAFLDSGNENSSKILNNYKRFEIGIRNLRPRLEVIRRDLPPRYEFYVRNLINYLRDARAKAVEPLFSDTVIPRTKP